MNKPIASILISGALMSIVIGAAHAADETPTTGPAITIHADKVAAQVSPTLYGLMTEEINYSYDGGLYGELIRNRVFKGSETPGGRGAPAAPATADHNLAHWSVAKYNDGDGAITIDTQQPLNSALGNSLKLDASQITGNQRVGVANDGYWGIPVRPNTTYRASFYARAAEPSKGPLTVSLESNDGTIVLAHAEVPAISSDWKQYSVSLKTGDIKESATNRFVISTGSPGVVWFNLVSLFPPTYNDRPNGNRVDIMQKLVDMKPAFLRFPGGNYLEGSDKENYFNWKITVGPVAQRPTHLSPWSYRSSDGMGLLEFLEWAQDMHAQPVLAVFAGFTLSGRFVAIDDDLKPFVQDALDEIEYVTGDQSTKWGAQRIADGHPEPFPLNFIEVGNEDNLGGGGTTYENRFAHFFDAIRAKYPKIKIISTAPVRGRVADFVDEHFYYRNAEDAELAAHRYDKRPRGDTRVFCGEWATRIGAPTTNLKAALADAAWLTGLERNSDLVQISCYAPIFVNVNPGGMQWASDMIGYDAMSSFGSPSYYAQKMFSNNIGDVVLESSFERVPKVATTLRPAARRGETTPPPARTVDLEQVYDVVTKDTKTGTVFLKVVNISGTPQPVWINLEGAGSIAGEAKCIVLTSDKLDDTNTITEPTKIVPVESTASGISSGFSHTFPPYSVTILKIRSK
jgi:alpha-N-arabinofuranosidase